VVQVDVFWAYGFGAGYALSAHRQLKAEYVADPAKADRDQWLSRSFVRSLLFMSLLFAPSGLYLLWAFPDWETMQVAVNHRSLPAWLVTAFAITNVTQGILGYWVTRRLIVWGSTHAALGNLVLAYVGFFFVLVHGWDGTGYTRFFSSNREDFLSWNGNLWYEEIFDWLLSDVALTLLGMGVIMLPVVYLHGIRQLEEGRALIPRREVIDAPSRIQYIIEFNTVIVGCGLVPAIFCSVVLHWFGIVPALSIIAVTGLVFLTKFLGWIDRRFVQRTQSAMRGANAMTTPSGAV